MKSLPPYATIEKLVGETPLEAAERLRVELDIPKEVSLAYAGRLDPMASGTLLILIGDECKKQTDYHGLDKTYEFQILFGTHTDTSDVLGILDNCETDTPTITTNNFRQILKQLTGNITLPYPHFSSKTVQGKPLHVWTLEGRIDEIEIPQKESEIFTIQLQNLATYKKEAVKKYILEKIELPTPVIADSKKLGANFRRDEVCASWTEFFENTDVETFTIATIRCTTSSGTYMRTLAEIIAQKLGTCGLAYSIHRTHIGVYQKVLGNYGFWKKRF